MSFNITYICIVHILFIAIRFTSFLSLLWLELNMSLFYSYLIQTPGNLSFHSCACVSRLFSNSIILFNSQISILQALALSSPPSLSLSSSLSIPLRLTSFLSLSAYNRPLLTAISFTSPSFFVISLMTFCHQLHFALPLYGAKWIMIYMCSADVRPSLIVKIEIYY